MTLEQLIEKIEELRNKRKEIAKELKVYTNRYFARMTKLKKNS